MAEEGLMKIQITARHCNVPDTLRAHVEREVEGLSRYYPRILGAQVTLVGEKHRHTAEIVLSLNHGRVVSKVESTDPQTSVDRVIAKVQGQLRRRKEQRTRRASAGGRSEQ